jgi:hypothetical protein
VEGGGEDVLGAVEEDQCGRELPRLRPRRHGESGDLGTGACAVAQGLGSGGRCLARCREEEKPHAEAFLLGTWTGRGKAWGGHGEGKLSGRREREREEMLERQVGRKGYESSFVGDL